MKFLIFVLLATMQLSVHADVVYGISPFYLSQGQTLKGIPAITKRLPEIKELGATVIWLQPITLSEEGDHGYDVIDYKSISPALGSEKDLHQLVASAHKLGLRVMLDMVLNHSSDKHPFVYDVLARGKESPYFEFYQHAQMTEIPYAQHFTKRRIGNVDFVHYFWSHLLNFNYAHPPLRDYLFDVLSYWVQRFDIDGYRFDASWGPSSRWPVFYKNVSKHLRKIKPGIILMAEDMIAYPKAYEGSGHPHLKDSGFDWAYDWNNADADWISKWSYQTGEGADETVFNTPDAELAADSFLKAIEYGQSEVGIKTIRYIENNDTPGFRRHHSLEQTKFAASVMFMLPGVPLIFYGQEIGNDHNVFELPSFDPNVKMAERNPELYKFYQNLILLRRSSKALSDGPLRSLKKEGVSKVSFVRGQGPQAIKVLIDFAHLSVLANGINITKEGIKFQTAY